MVGQCHLAVLLAAHIGAKQLNAVFVSIIIILYSLFSITITQVISQFLGQTFASAVALRSLSESQKLSEAGINVLNSSSAGIGISLWITLFITFASTIFYVIYSYKTKRHQVESLLESEGDS